MKTSLRRSIDRHIENGLVKSQRHPTLPLFVYTYTEKVQYEQLWDNVLLNCRGLVLDDKGRVAAQPFVKFFNHDQPQAAELLKRYEYEVYEKFDGSLGIAFCYEGQWIVTTKGSFVSEQAIKGQKMLDDCLSNGLSLDPYCTYLFEIIYPENRIVVDYAFKHALVMLACIRTTTAQEEYIQWRDNVTSYPTCELIIARPLDLADLRIPELKQLALSNAEGFVLKYSDGSRLKVKFDEYIRLHALKARIDKRFVWECLKSYGFVPESVMDTLPDEMFDQVAQWDFDLLEDHKWTKRGLVDHYLELGLSDLTRADMAKRVNTEIVCGNRSIFFDLYDRKNIDAKVWDIIKPERP